MSERVYGYIRVSGLGQRDKDGPERQKVAITAFAQEHGLDLVNIYEETISGTKHASDRPAFTQMVLDAETNGVTGVVVERLDRLARELLVQEVIVSKLAEEAHLHIYASDTNRLEDLADANADPTRVLIRQVLGALAQWNRSEIVRKLAYARKRKREATGRCEGPRPYGETSAERRVVQLVRSYVENGFDPTSISQVLNSAGLRTRKNKLWNRHNIHRILAREFGDYTRVIAENAERARRLGRLHLER